VRIDRTDHHMHHKFALADNRLVSPAATTDLLGGRIQKNLLISQF
jgi:hypothetical protein